MKKVRIINILQRHLRYTKADEEKPLESFCQNVKIKTKEVMHNGILRNVRPNLL